MKLGTLKEGPPPKGKTHKILTHKMVMQVMLLVPLKGSYGVIKGEAREHQGTL